MRTLINTEDLWGNNDNIYHLILHNDLIKYLSALLGKQLSFMAFLKHHQTLITVNFKINKICIWNSFHKGLNNNNQFVSWYDSSILIVILIFTVFTAFG